MITINTYPCQTNQESCGTDNDCACDCRSKCCPPNPCECMPPCIPCQKQCQEGCSATQGDLTEIMGDLTQSQGDQGETQGDQTQIQGDLNQSQGSLTETLGDQMQAQGEQSQTQGDLSETLGDQMQTQEGETQGNQTQGDQTQTMTGHEGQIQGDQFLLNTPTISAPVSVSGLNLNLTVQCGREEHPKSCGDCNDIICSFLRLLKLLQLSLTEPEATQAVFYGCCFEETPLTGTLAEVIDCCLAVITPATGENPVYVSPEALAMISIASTGAEPDLFSRLLSFLQSSGRLSESFRGRFSDCFADGLHRGLSCGCCGCGDHKWPENCDDRRVAILKAGSTTGARLQIDTACGQAEGLLYRICHGTVFLVDDPATPTEITAVPLCKVLCWRTPEDLEGGAFCLFRQEKEKRSVNTDHLVTAYLASVSFKVSGSGKCEKF